MKKVAVWTLLREREGITREEAERLVLAGSVRVGDEPVRRVGELVDPQGDVVVDRGSPYASRGGEKLAFALEALEVDVSGRVALDVGASTGGFSDCLLQHGAELVYAVDVGFGQLAGKLRADRRVVVYERTNISDPRLTELDPAPSLVTLDLSYLSLRIAVPVASRTIRGGGEIVALVKPLFETDDRTARRSGELSAVAARTAADRLSEALRESGFAASTPIQSPIDGGKGTVEFFVRVSVADAH